MKRATLTPLFCLIASGASAQGLELGGEIAAELRYYPSEPRFPDQFEHWQPSVAFMGDFRWRDEDRKHEFVISPFARIDGQDDARTHIDLREAYYRYVDDDGWSLTAGLAKVFWGRTESRHLVDIINQTDAVEDIDEEDKLGQPMINLTVLGDWGTLDLFAMSGFRERTFPGREGRLTFGQPVDNDLALYESDKRRKAPDFAARYGHYLGDFDFGVSVFHGTSREPRFFFTPGDDALTPIYDRITQGSVDAQLTRGALLLKAEAIVRSGHDETFFASVAGFEYTAYQVFGGADLGLLAEYQYDGRTTDFAATPAGFEAAAPFTIADNDLFTGARLALNDIQDTSFLVGATVDLDSPSTVAFVEASRRLGQNWRMEIEGRFFYTNDLTDQFSAIRDDDFVTMRLTRYF